MPSAKIEISVETDGVLPRPRVEVQISGNSVLLDDVARTLKEKYEKHGDVLIRSV